MLRVLGIRESGPRSFVSEEEIKHLAKKGRHQGVLDQTEMDIIHGVFDLSDTPVRKVMVPRPKVFALDADTPSAEVGRLIVESGFSRFPAYEDSTDNIVGRGVREGCPAGPRAGRAASLVAEDCTALPSFRRPRRSAASSRSSSGAAPTWRWWWTSTAR